jgi:hypothetical protein
LAAAVKTVVLLAVLVVRQVDKRVLATMDQAEMLALDKAVAALQELLVAYTEEAAAAGTTIQPETLDVALKDVFWWSGTEICYGKKTSDSWKVPVP